MTSIHEDAGSIPNLLSRLRIWHCHSCGVDHRRGSDLALLWLWCRLAAVAPIRPVAWELPDATGAALKKAKKKKIMVFIHGHPMQRDLYTHYDKFWTNGRDLQRKVYLKGKKLVSRNMVVI